MNCNEICIIAIILCLLDLPPIVAGTNDAQRAIATVKQINKHGRPVFKNERSLLENADLIVIGTVVAVTNLDEKMMLSVDGVQKEVFGVDTVFEISKVVRGTVSTNHVVLHHYRLENNDSSHMVSFDAVLFEIYNNNTLPPGLVTFFVNSTNKYLIYLSKDGTNRFTPASGQSDATFSVRALPHPGDPSYKYDADPLIRGNHNLRVPTRLLVSRNYNRLKIKADVDSADFVKVSIGTNMMVGIWCDITIYKEDGHTRLNAESHYFEPNGGALMPDASVSDILEYVPRPYYWNINENGPVVLSALDIPIEKKVENSSDTNRFDISMDLTLFETDSTKFINEKWNPKSARYYKILWQRTLKMVTE